VTAKEQKYFKLARPDGWDFRTGNTVNYRENLGKTVTVPSYKKYLKNKVTEYVLCSDMVLHASEKALDCFVGAKIPCSCYIVEGTPVVSSPDKCGFTKLTVLEEIPQEKLDDLFGFSYHEAANPINPLKLQAPQITNTELLLLQNWDSVWASVRDSVWASVRASVWASVGAYIGSMFPAVKQWKYAPKNVQGYPYQPCVDLWKRGIVPSFDGSTWRLHVGVDARIAYEITAKKLKEAVFKEA